MIKKFLLFSLAILLLACAEETPQPPADALSKEKFTAIMLDVQINEGMKSQRSLRQRRGEVDTENYEAILDKHGVSKTEFMTTYTYYRDNPGEMELVYEVVLDSLSRLEAEIKQSFSVDQKAERDSIREANRKIRENLEKIKSPR